MDQQSKKLELVKNQAKLLMNSFDAVQIIATRYDEESGNTETYTWGEGNFHTRMGMVLAWLREQESDSEDDSEETD